MKRLGLISLGSLIILGSCSESENTNTEHPRNEDKILVSKSPYELVNPFIGTGGHGHTYPGATVPFGMVQLSPDTRLDGWDGCSGYHYTDSVVYGFSHTHLSGTGVSDYGDILLFPNEVDMTGLGRTEIKEAMNSSFSKSSEQATPGWYSVHLDKNNIDVELTSTERVGIHKYTFNENSNKQLFLDLSHRDKVTGFELNILNDSTITGSRISRAWAADQRTYFVLQTSTPFTTNTTTETESLIDQSYFKEHPDMIHKMLRFESENNEVIVKVGISATSIDGAWKNLKAEAPHWNFEDYLNGSKEKWNQALSKIEVSGTNEDRLTIFYSALYHTMIAPNLFSDVDGTYRGLDGYIHQNGAQDTYTVFSLWDTFRATHPLYTIIEQKRTEHFLNTFLAQYQEGGLLPVWELAGNETNCMIGYHSVPVIVDAYVKGIRGFDAKLALKAMQTSATQEDHGLSYYQNQGFIGAGDEAESVSKTLEYAYDDWCIATMAELMNQKEIKEEYLDRALYYRNLYNPETEFLQARMNGNWFKPFDPAEVNFNYTEANAWQYSLFAPHDISGLIDLMGGVEQFEHHIDNLFTASSQTTGRDQADITGLIGQYAHGNEPSHHMAYLYNYIQKPEKTQERVQQILLEQYQNAPDGLSGNEDCGQMSAWYVLSSMGIYSVTPGVDYYAIGTPLFESVKINLENGNSFSIKANNLTDENKYIQSATLNGEGYSKSFILHQHIMDGGELVFEMGASPSGTFGIGDGNYPVAQTNSSQFVPAPYFVTEGMTFHDSMKVEIGCIDEDVDLMYIINGYKTFYSEPFYIKENTEIVAMAIHPEDDANMSTPITSRYKKIKKGRSIELLSKYANQYSAAGPNSLIDQLSGNTNYRTGFWQGYEGKDVIAIVDLGKEEEFNTISVGCLQDIKSWIWYPEYIEFYTSNDGKSFELFDKVSNQFPIDSYGAFNQQLSTSKAGSAKYIKVMAKNRGKCPDWHLGKGGNSWIFLDEITIDNQ